MSNKRRFPRLSSLLMLLVPSRCSQGFGSSSVWGFGGVVGLLAGSVGGGAGCGFPQLSSLLMLLVPSRCSQGFGSSSVWGDRSFGGVVALLAASGVVGVMGEVGFDV